MQDINAIIALSERKDEEINALMQRIEDSYATLSDELTVNQKYEIVVSTEYLYVKLRQLVEFEAITVKRIINTGISSHLKVFFTQRDVYLSQFSAKLTLLRDDISVLQKLQYLKTFKKLRITMEKSSFRTKN